MTQTGTDAYVSATAALLGIPMAQDRITRVSAHLSRTADLYRLLESVQLEVEDEPVALYCPAPFPDAAPGDTE